MLSYNDRAERASREASEDVCDALRARGIDPAKVTEANTAPAIIRFLKKTALMGFECRMAESRPVAGLIELGDAARE